MSISLTASEIQSYYEARLPKLKKQGAELRGPCPVHQGKRDSFAVNLKTGKAFCHSDCGKGWDVIGLEQELTGTDFKTALAEVERITGHANGAGGKKKLGPILAVYGYTDEAGKLLFQVTRHEPKDFRQRQPDGSGGWVWNLKGVRRILYRLPKVIQAAEVFVCEGEKDVHALEGLGLVATCNPMGAAQPGQKPKWLPEYAEMLRGKSVPILPDNDAPGRAHARAVAQSLHGLAEVVRIVDLPGLPEKGDVTDWIAAGGTRERLEALVRDASEFTGELEQADEKPIGGGTDTATEEPAKPKSKTKAKAKKKPGTGNIRLAGDAVVYTDPDSDDLEQKPQIVCGRLEVAARTRDARGDGWGRLLRWHDPEGRTHEWAMPMSMLAGDGTEYRSRLLDQGLYIGPGRKAHELLTVYLQTQSPETSALCVARVGWHGDNFILPGATFGPTGAETILFQTAHDTEHYLNVAGTVGDWRTHVGRFCSGNSRLILAVSCAFAGPLLSLVGGESGGIHFVGATSSGKTTALLVGGSVLGGGGRNGFVQSWRATANGLEAVAEAHNDLTLFLDELAQLDARDASEIAYLLSNGAGKSRMSRNIGARKKLTWALLFVSAGEVTLADHARTAGKRTKGGAEVRLLNIDADAGAGKGLFEKTHEAESPDAFSRQLKAAAHRFYGAPLRAYLDHVTGNRSDVERAVRNFQKDFADKNVPSGASGEVFRAAQRFGLIAAAGEIATAAGITGWQEGEAIDAAARCLKSWITVRGTSGAGDIEAGIKQVRRFLGVNGSSRFQSTKVRYDRDGNPISEKIVNRAGFRVEDDEGEAVEYLILPDVFRQEVCEGFDYREVARELLKREYLNCEPPSLMKNRRLPEVGKTWVYAVKASIHDKE